jgi:D-alanine-D-alanine ligase-like ATP-grasp enzyme
LEHWHRTLRVFGSVNAGSSNGRAVLSEEQVREIKTELAIGTRNAVLARQYHVSTSAICDIKKGRKWSEVAI